MKFSAISVLLKILIIISLILTVGCPEAPQEPDENLSPYTPSNPSPTIEATNVSTDVNLTWDCSDPENDALHYNVYFDTTAYPPRVVSDLDYQTYDPGVLLNDKTYYWKIEVYDAFNATVSGPLWSFSTPHEGIFANLSVIRHIGYYEETITYDDQITAWFDSSNISFPFDPLEADTVFCSDYTLEWDSPYYVYRDPAFDPFIQFSQNYIFTVDGNEMVPDLVDSITFPDCSPYMTNLNPDDTLSFDGFDVEWLGFCDGTIRFVILAFTDSTGVDIVTENDGNYSFTSSDLAPMNNIPGEYYLYMILENLKSIDASGYDNRGSIWAGSISNAYIYIE